MDKMKCAACGSENMMCEGCSAEAMADHKCDGALCKCNDCGATMESKSEMPAEGAAM